MKPKGIFSAFEGGHLDGALFGRPRPEGKVHPKDAPAEPGPAPDGTETRPDAER